MGLSVSSQIVAKSSSGSCWRPRARSETAFARKRRTGHRSQCLRSIDEDAVRTALLVGGGDDIDPGGSCRGSGAPPRPTMSLRALTDATPCHRRQIRFCRWTAKFSPSRPIRTRRAAHLLQLRGRTHVLHSAAALAEDGEIVWAGVDSVRVTLRDSSHPAFLGRYLADVG